MEQSKFAEKWIEELEKKRQVLLGQVVEIDKKINFLNNLDHQENTHTQPDKIPSTIDHEFYRY